MPLATAELSLLSLKILDIKPYMHKLLTVVSGICSYLLHIPVQISVMFSTGMKLKYIFRS